jgi:hypothetical protein
MLGRESVYTDMLKYILTNSFDTYLGKRDGWGYRTEQVTVKTRMLSDRTDLLIRNQRYISSL